MRKSVRIRSSVQPLAPYCDSNETVKATVEKAVEQLASMQNDDASFSSYGTKNAESIAQVIVVLTALGIDPAKDERFVKDNVTMVDALCSFYTEGGGFKHVAGQQRDSMATEQGYYALVAYMRLLSGKTSLYDMRDVTIKGNGTEEVPDDNKGDGTTAPDDNKGDGTTAPFALQMQFHDIYDGGYDAGWDEGHGVGYNEGHDDGLKDGLFSLVEKKIISVEVATQEAHMTEEEFLVQMKVRKEKHNI